MKRIKAGIALITMFGLLLGTAGVASAKTVSTVHHAKISQASTKITHQAKNQVPKKSAKLVKSVHKMAKSKPVKTAHKTVKSAKSLAKHTSKHVTKNA